ncbi:MAG: polymorphic toxin-type HINT domain-containing protein [Planctomycetales bacterium]|nr:polymorphic toxin-type HINT domain-containing protein [Planctomycetales bacterium]
MLKVCASVDLTGASRGVAATLQTSPLAVGSTIFVDLPEHGISADFTVREIRPCPTPIAGDGYLVTTKFIHENAKILDLRIEGSDEPIGTTASHPFWSEDRRQFVAAGELRVGENLLLADDTTRRVESITLRPTRETVYNIEVDGEHVFYVGEDGVLVHNTCPPNGYFGSTRFGQFAHSGFGAFLDKVLGLGNKIRIDRTRIGLRGVDITFSETIRSLGKGFRHAELKPLSKNGLRTFLGQLKRWRANGDVRGNVGFFMYDIDSAGNPIYYFIGVF